MSIEPDSARDTLRQLLATLAYRAAKVLPDVPPQFATFKIAPNAHTPVEIVAHLADLGSLSYVPAMVTTQQAAIKGGARTYSFTA